MWLKDSAAKEFSIFYSVIFDKNDKNKKCLFRFWRFAGIGRSKIGKIQSLKKDLDEIEINVDGPFQRFRIKCVFVLKDFLCSRFVRLRWRVIIFCFKIVNLHFVKHNGHCRIILLICVYILTFCSRERYLRAQSYQEILP